MLVFVGDGLEKIDRFASQVIMGGRKSTEIELNIEQ
jgi:hypothetical protein